MGSPAFRALTGVLKCARVYRHYVREKRTDERRGVAQSGAAARRWLANTTIATRLLTTTLDIQEKLVTSKLGPALAITANSAISEARRVRAAAFWITGRQIVLHEEIIAFIVLSGIIRKEPRSALGCSARPRFWLRVCSARFEIGTSAALERRATKNWKVLTR